MLERLLKGKLAAAHRADIIALVVSTRRRLHRRHGWRIVGQNVGKFRPGGVPCHLGEAAGYCPACGCGGGGRMGGLCGFFTAEVGNSGCGIASRKGYPLAGVCIRGMVGGSFVKTSESCGRMGEPCQLDDARHMGAGEEDGWVDHRP
jgi:hypothetical protein